MKHFQIANWNQCRQDEWSCNSGQCIDKKLKCNNKIDCKDRSDEYFCSGRFSRGLLRQNFYF